LDSFKKEIAASTAPVDFNPATNTLAAMMIPSTFA